ncbi:MAG: cation diffusion facilitator family transporter [Burkholderiales bacterium]|jgi:cation diffusion facilitator family transporter|nr:cation diffusion facilitator family transporter [Burkholderiales bacterium]
MNPREQLDELETEEDTPDRLAASKRVTWVSVLVNVFLSALQVVCGVLSNSAALIADGMHSLSDLLADFVVLLAVHHGKKEADEAHPYGHQRFETAASLVLGLLLLAVGVGMALSAANKLQNPEQVTDVAPLALWVALTALLSKELLFRYMLKVAMQVKSSMLVANAWHARSDAASSLVVGIGIAGNLLGYHLLDPVAAFIVGLMVGKMGWEFSWQALMDLTDRAADSKLTQAIRDDILATQGVLGVHDLKTRKTGDLLLVDVHIEVQGDLSVRQGHEIARQAKRNVMKKHPVLYLMTHLDPVD